MNARRKPDRSTDDLLRELRDWIGTDNDTPPRLGAQRMFSLLRRHGLTPGLFFDHLYDELIDDTLRFVQRGGVIDSVPAWATRVMTLRTKDLLRGDRRKSFGARCGIEGETIAAKGAPADLAEVLANRARVDEMRRALLVIVDDWRLAAGLTMIAVQVDGADPGSACPRPRGGVDVEEARASWAAAWYAGRRRAFDAPHAAVNRKRDIDATKRILASALGHAGYDRRRDV
jgi:hypothetical protein